MAFNFNWTPLTAPTSSPEFYDHAKQLLTSALNRSSQSSTIVDDEIVVEELNLGSTAPEIEVLEIGDLADDKFRGVFRIEYEGDACLTLKTRIQINPLSAHLLTTPSFTSPEPLPAASKSLSIPLQVTLSSFKLSGFVILVFSRAKGITLVFRNDPLESMKVQSTFDSVPFVRNYLQSEIERQVRSLFQEELPLAVYRLSLRLFNPEHATSLGLDRDPTETPRPRTEWTVDDDPLEPSIDAETEDTSDQPISEHVVRLIALVDSQKTLSLFTPRMTGVLYRATATLPPPPPSLPLFAEHEDTGPPTPISDAGSATSYGSSHLGSTSSGPRRKKRRRVVDLRQRTHKPPRPEQDTDTSGLVAPEMLSNLSSSSRSLSDTEYVEPAPAVTGVHHSDRIRRPTRSSEVLRPSPVSFTSLPSLDASSIAASRHVSHKPKTPPPGPIQHTSTLVRSDTGRRLPSSSFSSISGETVVASHSNSYHATAASAPLSPPQSVAYEYQNFGSYHGHGHSAHQHHMANKFYPQHHLPKTPSAGGGILERAFMMRLVGELQKRAEEERAAERVAEKSGQEIKTSWRELVEN